jgi:hypothetical protein
VTATKDCRSASVTPASNEEYQPFDPLQSLALGNSLVLTRTVAQDYRIDRVRAQDAGTSTDCRSRPMPVDSGQFANKDCSLEKI